MHFFHSSPALAVARKYAFFISYLLLLFDQRTYILWLKKIHDRPFAVISFWRVEFFRVVLDTDAPRHSYSCKSCTRYRTVVVVEAWFSANLRVYVKKGTLITHSV